MDRLDKNKLIQEIESPHTTWKFIPPASPHMVIEYTINSRLLTHLPLDDISAGVLTPKHFLLGSSDELKPLAVMDDSVAVVKKGWELSQIMANIFWRHWMMSYLPTINTIIFIILLRK
uniref:DUF5641 domain-containing protein n=1 Tax=Anopheles christyi TaxID=43041 RepID=A0A182K2Z3_9DIPT